MTRNSRPGRPGVWTTALGLALGLVTAPHPSAAAATDTPATVTIPFAPTLGKPIHLHSERHRTGVRGGVETPSEDSTSDDDLVFTERNADGYILRWTNTAATVRATPERQAAMEKVMAAGVGKTTVIQTNAHGAPVALLNAAETRALMASALDGMASSVDSAFAGKTQAERDALRKTFDGFVQMYKTMTDAQLGEVVLKDPRMLFGFGGAVFDQGRPITYQATVTVPVANAAVAVAATVALKSADAKAITLALSTTTDPADVKAAITAYLDKALARAEPAQRDAMAAAIGRLQDFQSTDEAVLELDATSGVIRHATHTRRVSVAGQSQVVTETYAAVQ